MDHDEAQIRMQEIQRVMERATLWTILPGTSAIIGGLMVNMASLAVQPIQVHGTGVVRDSFSTSACKEVQLRIMEIRMAGVTIGFYKFSPGN